MSDCCGIGLGTMLLWVGLFALIVVGSVLLIMRLWLPTRDHDDAATRSGIRLLEERFARGEIDHDEFQRRRDVLLS